MLKTKKLIEVKPKYLFVFPIVSAIVICLLLDADPIIILFTPLYHWFGLKCWNIAESKNREKKLAYVAGSCLWGILAIIYYCIVSKVRK